MPQSHRIVKVEPEVFLEHNGFTLFFVHPANDAEEAAEDYMYAFEDDWEKAFDVRELPNWRQCPRPVHMTQANYFKHKAEAGLRFLEYDQWAGRRKAEWNAWREDKVLENHNRQICREAIDLGYISPGKTDLGALYGEHVTIVGSEGEVVHFKTEIKESGAGFEILHRLTINNDVPGWLDRLNDFVKAYTDAQ